MSTAAVPSPVAAAAELHRGPASVRVAATLGAPITSFVTDKTDWCAAGAWRDYAPTAKSCTLPSFVAGAPKAPFPDGGVLGAEEASIDVRADGASHSITARWESATYPVRWERVVGLDAEGGLVLSYAATSAYRTPLPFVWGLGIPLAWSPSAGIEIARGARARVAAAHGEGLPGAGSEFAWPALRDGGRLVDVANPSSFGDRAAALAYVELARGRFAIHSGDSSLEISGDEGTVSHAHVWINNDADMPGQTPRRWWRRRTRVTEVTAGPSVGAPALLSDAVGGWNSARWLEPGETLRWAIRFRPTPRRAQKTAQ